MFNNLTIDKYLFKLFSKYFLITSFIIILVLFVSNAFDILQKFKSLHFAPEDFWQLISFKIPFLFNEVSVLIGFISTLLFLKNIITHNEMTIMIANGIPIWRIFLIPIIATFIFGVIILVLVNPIGTYGLKEYQKLEEKITNISHNNLTFSQSGIYFFEKDKEANRIFQAQSINSKNKSLTKVNVLLVDKNNQFLKRIDAESATLDQNQFMLNNPTIYTSNGSENLPFLKLKTKLSINSLIQRFTPPEMILIWYLPDAILKISKSGLSTINYQIYFYKQLFKPLAMASMVFLACWFVSFNSRDNLENKTLVLGLILGITIYFLLEIILRILAFSGLNPVLATLLPILFIILISNFVILHLQEA